LNIEKLTDEECLALMLELLATRVKLGTAYIKDEASELLTHQVLLLHCGELKTQTAPNKLSVNLLPVEDVLKERTVN
jgi:hypothetical protein